MLSWHMYVTSTSKIVWALGLRTYLPFNCGVENMHCIFEREKGCLRNVFVTDGYPAS